MPLALATIQRCSSGQGEEAPSTSNTLMQLSATVQPKDALTIGAALGLYHLGQQVGCSKVDSARITMAFDPRVAVLRGTESEVKKYEVLLSRRDTSLSEFYNSRTHTLLKTKEQDVGHDRTRPHTIVLVAHPPPPTHLDPAVRDFPLCSLRADRQH